MKKYDVIALGEALIDYIPTGSEVCGGYRAAVGGAPLNLAMGIARLSGSSALIARVGSDPLGREIVNTLTRGAVDCSLIQSDVSRPTTVTVVMPESADDQRYIMYRGDTADNAIVWEEIPDAVFDCTYILHIGALLSTLPERAGEVLEILRKAKQHGAVISFDVNMRPGCWKRTEDMIARSREIFEYCDIIKMTAEEEAQMKLFLLDASRQGKVIVVTDNENTVRAYWNGICMEKPVKKVETIDATGAGDAFFAAFLYEYISNIKTDREIGKKEIERCMEIAMKAGAYAVQNVGAFNSCPTHEVLYG